MSEPLILLVDDDWETLDVAREVLEGEGYSVETAPNGRAALDRLRELDARPPSLMVVDLMMPLVDGASLIREVEGAADLPHVPIVVMTASGPSSETSSLPYPLLRKPFDIDTLVEVVSKYCPRLWDDDEAPTEEDWTLLDPAVLSGNDATPVGAPCVACGGRGSTRCTSCGDSYCRACLDAGPDGKCARCFRGRAFGDPGSRPT